MARDTLILCMALAAFAFAQGGAVAQNTNNRSEPKPIGDPASWIRTEDYPRDALRHFASGRVGFTLTLDESGKITKCEVSKSSGNQALDDGTCALMISRAQYAPARDAYGRPVAGSISSAVNWKIPDDGALAARQTVNPMEDCRIGFPKYSDTLSVKNYRLHLSFAGGQLELTPINENLKASGYEVSFFPVDLDKFVISIELRQRFVNEVIRDRFVDQFCKAAIDQKVTYGVILYDGNTAVQMNLPMP